MLQWHPSSPDRSVIFNQRDGDQFNAVVLDIITGERRTVPRPVAALSRSGEWALSLNFARLHATQAGYGYPGVTDACGADSAPDGDGVYLINMLTGETRLLISLGQIAEFSPDPSFSPAKHWVNHFLFNLDDTRFCFVHRWARQQGAPVSTRLFTADINGENLCCLEDSGFVSHFDWRSERELLAWAREEKPIGAKAQRGITQAAGCSFLARWPFNVLMGILRKRFAGWVSEKIVGDRFALYSDMSAVSQRVGAGVLREDAHCSYSPDRRWILMDTYPHEDDMRKLFVFDTKTQIRVDIGAFYSPREYFSEVRCDLHAKWDREGKRVCIDSAHDGTRQIYSLEIAELLEVNA